ncbi:TonB-dependent receptor [Salibacteraceae bacterium]|jgi:iron complex outermembrane recepter protein|nr:TonB-dependent receptor [Salibacteraceae bacterium]
MQRLFACVLFLAMSMTQHAQNQCDLSISGRIIDEHDGSALSYANIQVLGQGIGTISDSTGAFSLSNVCPGQVILACSHVGCETIYDTLIVTTSTTHNFYPEHHTELLNTVSIQGYREKEVHVMSRVAVSNLERTAGSNLGSSLTDVLGVTELSTGTNVSKPVIHGLHSNRVLILNNGVRQEGQQWGNEHAPEIDPFIAGELLVIKGANSVQYGSDAIAGVVVVNPKPLPDSIGIGGAVLLSAQSNGRIGASSVTLEGRNRKIKALRWRTQGSLKKGGNQKTPDYFLGNTGVEEWNFSGTVSLADENKGVEIYYSQFNSNLGILSASHIGNLTDLQLAYESDTPLEMSEFTYDISAPYQHVTHELIKGKGFVKTGEKAKLTFTYARQYNLREEYDRHRNTDGDPALNFEITTHSVDGLWSWNHGNRSSLKIGTNVLSQVNTFSGRFFIPNFTKWNAGLFAIEQWQFRSMWKLEVGMRIDHVSQSVYIRSEDKLSNFDHVYTQPSGSIGLVRTIASNWTWRSNFGTAWRPPMVNEMYSNGVHHGAATFEKGDTSLNEEVSYSFSSELGYVKNRFQMKVEVFANYMNNFINLQPTFPATLTIRGAFPTFQYVQTDALLYGLDAEISYQIIDGFRAISKTSILRARDLSKGDWLAQMPADQSSLALEYSFLQLKNGKTAYVGVDGLWENKQWRVPANSDYVSPPSSYFLMGTSAGITLPAKFGELGINLEINNLLNQRYRNYLNRYRYFTDEIGRNIALRISVTF